MTCKGIPHYSKPYLLEANYIVSEEEAKKMKKSLKFIQQRVKEPTKDKMFSQHVRLKDRYYIYKGIIKKTNSQGIEECINVEEVKACITFEDMLNVREGNGTVTCIYGAMQRSLLQHSDIERTGIALDYCKRGLSEKSWWDKGKRICIEGEDISFPIGYDIK